MRTCDQIFDLRKMKKIRGRNCPRNDPEIPDPIQEGICWVWTQEKKPTANRRESRKPSACSQNRICFPSLEHGGPYRKSKICSAKGEPVGSPRSSRRFIPHRDRSGKSCRRPSASFMRSSGYSHFSDIFHQNRQISFILVFPSCRN